jgi:hypothetical protein
VGLETAVHLMLQTLSVKEERDAFQGMLNVQFTESQLLFLLLVSWRFPNCVPRDPPIPREVSSLMNRLRTLNEILG